MESLSRAPIGELSIQYIKMVPLFIHLAEGAQASLESVKTGKAGGHCETLPKLVISQMISHQILWCTQYVHAYIIGTSVLLGSW